MLLARVVLFSLALLFLTPFNSAGNTLPRTIGSLTLEKNLSDEEARQEIDRLHGKRLKFRKGYIGTYRDGNQKAKLWVSEHDSEAEAAEAIGKMVRRIKSGKQKTFWHFREIPMEGMTVYFVMGMGQAHYFFQKGVKAVWLAVDSSLAKEAIRDVIGKIP